MSNGITPATQPNKDLYNGGSEWQNDYVDLPDYYQTFFRNYDAALGRFVGVDPQAESAESMTPYHYALNNPGMLNDPMGDLAGRPIFPDYMNGMYGNQENAPVAANFQRSYQYTNDDLANLDSFHSQIERETVQYFSSQLDVLRGYFGVAKSPNGLVRYYDEDGSLNNILESNLPGNMSRQDFRVSDTRIEVRTISEDGPNAANPFWVDADKQIAKGVDLAVPIYEAAKFYAGGEFFEAGLAISGLSGLIGKGIGNLADRFAPTIAKATETVPLKGVTANRAAGKLFEDELAIEFRAAGRIVNTGVYKSTPFGKRFIDLDIWYNGVNLGGIEAKVGGSRYLPLQRLKDAWLGANGYPVQLVRKSVNW